MKLTEEDYEYLCGRKFSSGYNMALEGNSLKSRLEFLIELTEGKRVIHIGCCDHIPLIKEKIRTNSWLQGILEKKCKQVLGIDINKEAIDYIQNEKLSNASIICMDLGADVLQASGIDASFEDYNVMLLGEIVEHLDNPVEYLKNLVKNSRNLGFYGKYIITVPNAFCFLKTTIYSEGVECINSDHRYWFTPYTISKVLCMAGMKPNEIIFSNYDNQKELVSYKGDQMIIIAE